MNNELVSPADFGIESLGLSCLFATAEGPVIGLQDGQALNLINDNVTLPTGCGVSSGAIMVVDTTTVLQSGE